MVTQRGRKWLTGFAVAALFLGALGWIAHVKSSGPLHKGRRVSAWVAQVRSPEGERSQAARRELVAIGPPALPYVVRGIERSMVSRPITWLDRVARRILPPRWRPQWLTPEQQAVVQARFLNILETFGPAGASAAPVAAKAMAMSPHVRVQSAAAEALGAMGPEAIPVIRRGIGLQDYSLRVHYYRAAYRLGTNVEPLTPDLMSRFKSDPADRPYIALAIGNLGPGASSYYRKWLQSNDPELIALALRTSMRSPTPDPQLVPFLLELQERPELMEMKAPGELPAILGRQQTFGELVYRSLASHALVSKTARAALRSALWHEDPSIQSIALKSLAQRPHDAALELPRLIELARTSETRHIAIDAIECIAMTGRRGRPALPLLREVMDRAPAEFAEPARKAHDSIVAAIPKEEFRAQRLQELAQ